MSLKRLDIVIAGGGMVGCALACALAKNTKLSAQKITLLEGAPEQKFTMKEQYSNRVSALNPGTKKFMSSIGVWKHIENARLQEVKRMQVWDSLSDAMITFNHDHPQKDVAYIVENDVLLHAVNKELSSSDNANLVEVVYNSKIKDYDIGDKSSEENIIHMENGDKYSCKLLVS